MNGAHVLKTGAVMPAGAWPIDETAPAGRAGQSATEDYNGVAMESTAHSGQPRSSDLTPEMLRPTPAGSESEHMMLVSPSFDILMLHPAFETVWHRAASTFLGKKCYHEIEKRDEPCPHCPGVIALKTGNVAEVESCAVLDDGVRVPFVLRAFPIYGVDGEPAGFVENCENISERRRGEDDARFEASLNSALFETSSTHRVLSLGLNAALRIEGAHSGCALILDTETGTRELVAEHGFSAAEVDALDPPMVTTVVAAPEADSLLVRVPVCCHGRPAAELAMRFSTQSQVWPNKRPKLEALASVMASALTRIQADRLRGDAGTNIETIVSILPLPALFCDSGGKVTVWNRGAERVFGWGQQATLGHAIPFVPPGDEGRFMSLVAESGATIPAKPFAFDCLHQDGHFTQVYFQAGLMNDILGDGTSYLLIASTSALLESGWIDGAAAAPTRPLSPRPDPGTMEPEVTAAAAAFAQLFSKVTRRLSAPSAQGGFAAKDGELTSGSMSVAWAEDGSLDLHVTLPAAEPTAKQSPPRARILVIQNDEAQGTHLGRVLTDLGCTAIVCTTVSAALDELRAAFRQGNPLDIAIVEMVTPGGSGGIETAKLLRTVEPNLPVVVSSETTIVGHVAHGFAGAIRRPYDDDSVRQALEVVLREATG